MHEIEANSCGTTFIPNFVMFRQNGDLLSLVLFLKVRKLRVQLFLSEFEECYHTFRFCSVGEF
jgi:hypothetical protein